MRTNPRHARRSAPLMVILAAVIGAGVVGWFSLRHAPRAVGPIVLLSIDTLRADRLPLYGYRGGRTPAIDAFAREAIVFERAYSHSPQTLPSHTSMLSGKLPFEHGVRDNIGFTVDAGVPLLPELLRPRGFVGAAAVSAYVLRRETGLARGFDRYDSELPAASPEMSIGQVQRDGADTIAASLKWIDGQADKRQVFLFLHLYEPHKPYTPPARYAPLGPYDGEVAHADELTGQFLDALRERGLYDEATILFVSDHGEGLGDHGEQEHGLFLYDESIRVPFIAKMAGNAGGGRRVTAPVQLIDVVPTLLDLTGVPRPDGLRGRSLRPLLEGEAKTIADEGIYSEALYSRYHFGWSELYALTDARYRFIKAPTPELYDLQNDPGEKVNIAGERRQASLALRGALDRLLAGSRVTGPSQVSAEDRQRLAALGYVSIQAEIASDVPGEALPDPKDKLAVLETYREASELAGQRHFDEAATLYRRLLHDDPQMSDVWLQLAQVLVRSGSMAEAVDAYKRVIAIRPTDAGSLIGAASGLLRLGKLEEARQHAELAVKFAPAGANELLAKVALARNDADAARKHAELAHEADPNLPMPLYVQALLHYKAQRYEDALPLFREAIRQLRGRTLQMNELHFYTGDALARLERYAEAEAEFQEEIRLFPHNTRPRASLAMLYRAVGRHADSERAIEELVRAVPTREGYSLAGRLWTMFGEPDRALAVERQARDARQAVRQR